MTVHHTSDRLAERGLSMAKIGPLIGPHLAVLAAIGEEVNKAPDIYAVVDLLEECLGAKVGARLFDLVIAREKKVVALAAAEAAESAPV